MKGYYARQDSVCLQKQINEITLILEELLGLVGRDPQDLIDFTRSEKVRYFPSKEKLNDYPTT